jgi:DNA-binding transcriptional regulator YiaG
MPTKTFAQALRRWRKAQGGITKAEAARRLGVPYRTWQNWELGINEPRGLARRLILESLAIAP